MAIGGVETIVAKPKKPILIPFTGGKNRDLITYWTSDGGHCGEIAGSGYEDRPRAPYHGDVGLHWKSPKDCAFEGSLVYVSAYTGRSRARVVFRIKESGSYIEMTQDDFNGLMLKFGMDGRTFPAAPYIFVKRGNNFLCKPDWDKIGGKPD